ncbi:hypothetical protein BpHYR1_026232 [Brachionus plicatilis]|uniref:Uncharacterized protein n=1 Tax=Brachionus plicatilis TaxID=10195 RepID=A0A3M7T493_BRAPC|nr:hypothetical protein BpHYR1_026232 [Brachionus plicatilis]
MLKGIDREFTLFLPCSYSSFHGSKKMIPIIEWVQGYTERFNNKAKECFHLQLKSLLRSALIKKLNKHFCSTPTE